ncbi:MAG TPA: hypothetical protein VL523_17155 [Terriglobia bacterium]|nr:hypothetical protein [Terriglobia bacterium]
MKAGAPRIPGAVLAATLLCLPLAAAEGSITIPAGTTLAVELTSTLSTKTNQTGDLFTGKVTEPIIYQGDEVVPESSTVEGHVTFLLPPGRAKGRAEMRLVMDVIKTPDGHRYSVAAAFQDAQTPVGVTAKGSEGTLQGPGKDAKSGAKDTGIGAGAGAAVGAIADGGTGALYGAAVGAIVGIVHAIAKHHGELVLPAGTDMTFVVPRTITATAATTPGALLVPDAH